MANKVVVEFEGKGTPKLINGLRQVENAGAKVTATTKRAAKATGDLAKANQEAQQGLFGLIRGMRNLGDSSSGTAMKLSVVRSRLLIYTFAIGGAVRVVNTFLRAAGDLEEQQNKMDVVFGASATMIRNWSEGFADATGRSATELQSFASSVQDILVPIGIFRNDAAMLSKQITELAVDVASFNNRLEPDVMRDFNSALVGNHETVRKYGIVISEARMKLVAYRTGITQVGQALSDQEKIQARLAIIQNDSSDAIGDAVLTQGSYVNSLKRFQSEVKTLTEIIGSMLLPSVTGLLRAGSAMIGVFTPGEIRVFTTAIMFMTAKLLLARAGIDATTLSVKGLKAALTLGAGSLGKVAMALAKLVGVFAAFKTLGNLFDVDNSRLGVTEEKLANITQKAKEGFDAWQKGLGGKTEMELNKELEQGENRLQTLRDELKNLKSDLEAAKGPAFERQFLGLFQTSEQGGASALGSLINVFSDYEEQIAKSLSVPMEVGESFTDYVDRVEDEILRVGTTLDMQKQKQAEVGKILDDINNKSVDFAKGISKLEDELKKLGLTTDRDKMAFQALGLTFDEMNSKQLVYAKVIDKIIQKQGQLKAADIVSNLRNELAVLQEKDPVEQRLLKIKQDLGAAYGKESKVIEVLVKLLNEETKLKKKLDERDSKRDRLLNKSINFKRQLIIEDIKFVKNNKELFTSTKQYNQILVSLNNDLEKTVDVDTRLNGLLGLSIGHQKELVQSNIDYVKSLNAEQISAGKKEEILVDLNKQMKDLNQQQSGAVDFTLELSQTQAGQNKILQQKLTWAKQEIALGNTSNEMLQFRAQVLSDINKLENESILSSISLTTARQNYNLAASGGATTQQKLNILQDQEAQILRIQTTNADEQIQKLNALTRVRSQINSLLATNESLFNQSALSTERLKLATDDGNLSAEDKLKLLAMEKKQVEDSLVYQGDQVSQKIKLNALSLKELQLKKALSKEELDRENMQDRFNILSQTYGSTQKEIMENFESLTSFERAAMDLAIEKETIENRKLQLQKDFNDGLIDEITYKAQLLDLDIKLAKNKSDTNDLKEEEMSLAMKFARDQVKNIGLIYGMEKKASKGLAWSKFIMATIDAYSAAGAAYKRYSELGLIAANIARASALAVGLANANQIRKSYDLFQYGGLVGGKSHGQGGTVIEAERGEFVMRKEAVDNIGLDALEELNRGGNTGSVVVNVSGNVMTQDFVENELADSIKEAIRRGSDFGVS
tara:strand:- start:1030 stop:4749 length:3720 start_codon:yes stop_codon:yes gene_type:complete